MTYHPWIPGGSSDLAPARSAPAVTPRQVQLRYLGAREEPEPVASAKIRFTIALIAAAVAGFHGYKRNRGSKGWAFLWAVGGAICPAVTLPFVFSQGFAKSAKE